jgi:heat shock protein HtpX
MYDQISSNIWRSRILLVLFFAFITGMGVVFYYAMDQPIMLPLAILIAAGMSIGGYYYSDKIVLASMRARPAGKDEFPHFVNCVEGLAIAAGLPCPRAYVIDDPAPNAFATGRDPEHAVVCATTGLIGMMNRVELEGVVGHEMSHIKNYDIRFMALVGVLVGAVALLADWFWWSGRLGGFGSRDDDEGGGQFQVIFFAIGIVFAILAPIAAALIQASISKRREYLADANGALLTRYPEGLASALERIEADPNPLSSANKATAHLFIANPLKDHGGMLNHLFDTHPPIEDRVRKLREM